MYSKYSLLEVQITYWIYLAQHARLKINKAILAKPPIRLLLSLPWLIYCRGTLVGRTFALIAGDRGSIPSQERPKSLKQVVTAPLQQLRVSRVLGDDHDKRIVLPFGDVPIAGEGLQILTYAWHSWPLISEGSLVCHTYCEMGQPFIMVTSEDP